MGDEQRSNPALAPTLVPPAAAPVAAVPALPVLIPPPCVMQAESAVAVAMIAANRYVELILLAMVFPLKLTKC